MVFAGLETEHFPFCPWMSVFVFVSAWLAEVSDGDCVTNFSWPPHAKSWLIGKDSDAGRDWGQEEKGTTEDEMAEWHHWLDGRESEWTPGDGDGQGGLACCDSWGCKESDTTERLNWTELNVYFTLLMCTNSVSWFPFIMRTQEIESLALISVVSMDLWTCVT